MHRALDARKDQSYFLYRMNAAWLPKVLFPVGHMQKQQVWQEAEALGLPVEELKESQEICFVSHGDYRTFLEKERPELKQPGSFVGVDGQVLGRHEGIAFYTPGQRRGLGVAVGQRLYVQKVVPESAQVVLCAEEQLVQSQCVIGDLRVFDEAVGVHPVEAEVKIRYASPPSTATLLPSGEGRLLAQFHQPQRALSPGQSAVFYAGDRVLGESFSGPRPQIFFLHRRCGGDNGLSHQVLLSGRCITSGALLLVKCPSSLTVPAFEC